MQYMLVMLKNTNERDYLTKVQSSEAQITSNVVLGRERERERERERGAGNNCFNSKKRVCCTICI